MDHVMNYTLKTNEPADFSVDPLDQNGNSATFNGVTPSISVDNGSLVTVTYEVSSNPVIKVVPAGIAGNVNIVLSASVGGTIITGTLSLALIDPPPLATQIGFTFLKDV